MLATNAILFFIVMWIAYDPSLANLVIFLCMWIKLNISGTFVVSYLQVKLNSLKLVLFLFFFFHTCIFLCEPYWIAVYAKRYVTWQATKNTYLDKFGCVFLVKWFILLLNIYPSLCFHIFWSYLMKIKYSLWQIWSLIDSDWDAF